VQIADVGGGGLLAAFSLVTALLARERLGQGQFVDISMTDGALTWNCLRWGKYLADGKVPSAGDDFLNHGYACYNVYETRDGRHMSWAHWSRSSGRDSVRPLGARNGTNRITSTRVRINRRCTMKSQPFSRRRPRRSGDHFARFDCCCEPILDLAEVMDDPEMVARKMVVELVHESWGAYRQLGIAPKFS